jgi:hypothetical protein
MASDDIEEKLRKLASIDGRQAQLAWLFYLSGEGPERQESEEMLDIALFQLAGKGYPKGIFLEPPTPAECAGGYPLGSVIYPPGAVHCDFGLREEEWTRHMLITGMTGAGKTTLMFHMLGQLRSLSKPFLVFDWKRNYRDLLQLPEFANLRVFTVGRAISPFHFNPLLPPPGSLPGEWLMKLVDIIKHAYFVGEGVEYLLRDAIDATYQECGIFDGKRTATPTFRAVRVHLARRAVHGRMGLWKASAMRAVDSLCFRHGLGPVVNADEQWDYAGNLTASVVLELDTLSDVDKVFLTEAIILWLYELRKNQGERETFKHALVIEEGHHVLSQHKEHAAGTETIMETSLRQIREFGEAVIVIDQEPTKLSNSIKANTACKITFALGNGLDALEMATCMGLNREEAEALNLLQVGHAVVTLKGRVFQPLHVRFPRVEVRKGAIRDEQIRPDSSKIPLSVPTTLATQAGQARPSAKLAAAASSNPAL